MPRPSWRRRRRTGRRRPPSARRCRKPRRRPTRATMTAQPLAAAVVAGEQNGGGSSVAAAEEASRALEAKDSTKAQQSFALSGKLAEETNKVRGVSLLFTEPPEARKPTTRWRLYFSLLLPPPPRRLLILRLCTTEPLYIHRQSCYLFGRERKVVDVPTDHPSCSKQHAVIQFRCVPDYVSSDAAYCLARAARLTDKEDKETLENVQAIRPYLMDLGSTNGTFLNGKRIEAQRYVEMLEKDTVKFGNSSPALKYSKATRVAVAAIATDGASVATVGPGILQGQSCAGSCPAPHPACRQQDLQLQQPCTATNHQLRCQHYCCLQAARRDPQHARQISGVAPTCLAVADLLLASLHMLRCSASPRRSTASATALLLPMAVNAKHLQVFLWD
eukprot:SM000021S06431  [mRNA]  locus=s21:191157:193475:+ [translate_table: standard]